MRKINKYQTTELFNNDSEKLNGYKNFIALTKDDNIIHLKKVIKKIPGVIYINQLESDPAKMITGDVNGEIIQWIRQNSHRVLAKKTGEGTVTYIELDDTNSNKYAADGSEAKTDGTEGDVFVKLPTFYYRGNDDGPDGSSGDNVEIKFSKEPFDDCVEWDTNILIGAYEGYFKDNKLYSVSQKISSRYDDINSLLKYASNRGTGYQSVDWQMHCILCCLFYAMYGNTNSQSICGIGSSKKDMGATNNIGMNDTKAETNGDESINFWGLENWWGNRIEYIKDFASADSESRVGTITVYDPVSKGEREINYSFEVPDYFEYPSKMFFGKYLDIFVTDKNIDNPGGNNKSYCDIQYFKTSGSQICICRSGFVPNSIRGLECGISYISMSDPSSPVNSSNGCARLAFRGVCTKAESVEAFKALPIL